MKIYAYEVRQDEMDYFKEYEKKYGVSVVLNHQVPTLENADNVDGCIGVTILGQGDINAKLLDKWYDLGIRYVSSRTIGLNHIDLEHAREIGIQVCNAKYPPNGVAEFALMLLLMCMRNYKQALWRGQVNDYSLSGLQGKELHDLTVGVMGTGNIGRTFVQLNAKYPPNGVAEFALMLLLMCMRNYKQALWRGQVNDYSLSGLQGKELHDLTVGVMGTGNIGRTFVQLLSGFGCRILAYDLHENEDVKKYATYVDKDTLLKESDAISLHLPLFESTYHLINKETIQKMKDNVILINCSRGELIDTEDIIEAIESKKIGALGLDVIEGEEGITHIDHRSDILSNKNMAYLHQFPNVIMTQHMAFYTNTAVKNMVKSGIKGIIEMANQ